MKRFLLCALAVTLLAPTSALGFTGAFDYVGHVKGNPAASVGFFVGHQGNGPRKVSGFTVSQVPYTCRDAPDGVTAGWQFEPKMRVKSDRTFFGTGDWTGLPLDPFGLVRGKFRHSGVVVGNFKLRGELAGSDTHCRTGLLEYRATKKPPPD